MNEDIKKIVGTPVEGGIRSDNEASGRAKTVSLGEGKFLPDTARMGYGSEGVEVSDKGRSGPTGRT